MIRVRTASVGGGEPDQMAPASPPEPLRVRQLQVRDWRILKAIRLDSLAECPRAFQHEESDEASRSDDFWRSLLYDADSPWVVAEVDEEPVAVARVTLRRIAPGAAVCFVESVWVRPAWRRRGVARAMVITLQAWAVTVGASELRLWVFGDNAEAIEAWTKLGFTLTTRRQSMDTWRGAVCERQMTRLLDG